MNTKTLDFNFQLKSISDAGKFSGYGSVFGVKDSYDDIIVKGAFTESLASYKKLNRMPSLLWQHRSAEPLGVYTSMEEDDVGLKLDGQLALGTVRGSEAHQLMKMGAISGLSIGYITPPGGSSFDTKTGILTITKVDLKEVSLVTFPANDSARIHDIKSMDEIIDLKTAERYLRDANFSRNEAVAFIAQIKKILQSDSASGIKQLAEAVKRRSLPA